MPISPLPRGPIGLNFKIRYTDHADIQDAYVSVDRYVILSKTPVNDSTGGSSACPALAMIVKIEPGGSRVE